MSSEEQDSGSRIFQRLKVVCVPLLANSRLDPRTSSVTLKHLADLASIIQELHDGGISMQTSLISYVFFPVSNLLSRNTSSSIPDQVLERCFLVLRLLMEDWWWACDLGIWEQFFILASATVGSIDGKGKIKQRDDETLNAACELLWTLLRPRERQCPEVLLPSFKGTPQSRFENICLHCQSEKFTPVIGRTLNSLLETSKSPFLRLQLTSLKVVNILITDYLQDGFAPSILPGVVSSTTRVALGETSARDRAMANGEVVDASLTVLQNVVIRAIGDEVCLTDGAIRKTSNLEDLTELMSEGTAHSLQNATGKHTTLRTASWLRGASSQMLIALNTLRPLVSHTNPTALCSLCDLSYNLVAKTHLTLPQAQPLLLSFLLSLSNSGFEPVSRRAKTALLRLISPPDEVRFAIQETLLRMTTDNLSTIPRLLPTRAESRIEHLAGQIEAVCRLGYDFPELSETHAIRIGVGKLLGPTGRIERWGWGLLSVIAFEPPPISQTQPTSIHSLIEYDRSVGEEIVFPILNLRFISSPDTLKSLERMFIALGRAGGETCLFSVEWFTGAGFSNSNSQSVAALWCACNLLQGIMSVSLDPSHNIQLPNFTSKRAEKMARALVRSITEVWDIEGEGSPQEAPATPNNDLLDDSLSRIEFVKGLSPIKTILDTRQNPQPSQTRSLQAPFLHKAFALRLLCICSAILRSRFIPNLIYALYPILHSAVSSSSFLTSTALASLRYITNCLGYASPGNLLLSNFDYALDSISRRLTRRWLDLDATKVLVILVRLVGNDIVNRASDVVEECFDRLDDFHGYSLVVEGLVDTLLEVVKAIEPPIKSESSKYAIPMNDDAITKDSRRLELFFEWFNHRNDVSADENEDYGPAPRRPWGKETELPTEDGAPEEVQQDDPGSLADPPQSPTEALTKQIVSRSIYFLTHGSSTIRARILNLLTAAVPILPESALLPSVHKAWPFILNRLSDRETFIISAAAELVEALAIHVGNFMTMRIWDDIWPLFQRMLKSLESSDAVSALTRRGMTAVGTESAYTHSHRLYRAMLRTMIAGVKGIQLRDSKTWEVAIAFRRFLSASAHQELQLHARELYVALGQTNEDSIWLILSSTMSGPDSKYVVPHLRRSMWDIQANVDIVFQTLWNTSN